MSEDAQAVTYLDLQDRETICSRILGMFVLSGVGWYDLEDTDAFRAGDISVIRPIPLFTSFEDFVLVTNAMFAKGFGFKSSFKSSFDENKVWIGGEWTVAFTTDLGTFKYSHPNLPTTTAKAALLAIYGRALR